MCEIQASDGKPREVNKIVSLRWLATEGAGTKQDGRKQERETIDSMDSDMYRWKV